MKRALQAAKSTAMITVRLTQATGSPRAAVLYAVRHVLQRDIPVEMRWQGLRFQARGCDWAALQEVLIEDEYGALSRYLKARPKPVVLDLGANIGTFGLFSFSVAPGAQVWSFEPSTATYAILEANRALNPQCNWRSKRAAAWSEDGTVSFANSRTSTGARVADGGNEAVPSWSFDHILKHCGGRIDLAKIDIEGAEGPLIGNAAATLPHVETMVIELHPDRCDAAQVSAILRQSYGLLYQIPGRRSSKPLLLATRSSVLPDLPIYDA